MGGQRKLTWLVILSLPWILAGCNPFLPDKGGAGQPCLNDGSCRAGLFCVGGICDSGWPDGGPDGDADLDGGDADEDGADGDGGEADEGDLDPCQAPGLDCSRSGLSGQGPDVDGDGWGRCCDCDDGAATIHPLAPEDCNGLDDDCDQLTDEELENLPCPKTAGVCAGATRSCQGGVWTDCDYGADHDPAQDSRCDGLDNDCDGQTDEDVVIRLEAESGPQAGDGIDNNCNGLIDEPGGVMVPIVTRPGIWIDSYEITVFATPDCTGERYGEASDDYPADWPAGDQAADRSLYACSIAGSVPSSHLSWYRARRACVAQGKRLCSKDEMESACSGGAMSSYPYHIGFIEGVCNDPYGGSGGPAPSGSFAQCTAAGQFTWDMSGNLAEWVAEWSPDQDLHPGMALVAGYGFACLICWNGATCHNCDPDNPNDRNDILQLLNCVVGTGHYESFPVEQAYPFIGTRCCLDGP